ncbi:hypothetical protein Ancab_036872 [Ancistrocladus abbreviatus]
MSKTPHVAILPSPGMGHLIPLIQLAKRLAHNHGFSITFIIPADGSPSNAQKSTLEALPPSMSSVFLPPVNLDDLSEHTKIETRISVTVARSLPSLQRILDELKASKPLVALVVDLFGTDALDAAWTVGIKPYIFFPSTAMNLSLFFYLPELDTTVSCEYREMDEPVRIPGCTPIQGKLLLDPVQDRNDDAYKWVLHHAKRYKLAEGVMVNSFPALEGGAIKALQEPEPGKPPVYPVGPLVQTGSRDGVLVHEAECLRWLDDQPHGSVLYVSFGSGGTLPHDQLMELALGLENSGQRFLWVVRSPNDKTADAMFFSVESPKDPLEFLPSGFLDRIKGRALVIPSWAPQFRVLSHGSTGGFLTHCGWNSILESVVCGIPLIVWPLYAEQKSNSVILTQDLKVALKPNNEEDCLIRQEKVAKVVRDLMEGKEGEKIRNRIKNLKNEVAKVLNKDGSSSKALDEVALKWKALHA